MPAGGYGSVLSIFLSATFKKIVQKSKKNDIMIKQQVGICIYKVYYWSVVLWNRAVYGGLFFWRSF